MNIPDNYDDALAKVIFLFVAPWTNVRVRGLRDGFKGTPLKFRASFGTRILGPVHRKVLK